MHIPSRGHSPLHRFARLAAAVLLLFSVQRIEGHVVSQIYAEFYQSGDSCGLEFLFDAGFADPATRNDPTSPQPTRDWLVALAREEQTRLAIEARNYLDSLLSLESPGGRIECRFEFPDFATTPPCFPILLNDGAYFRIRMIPLTAVEADLVIRLANGDHPDFVIKLSGPGEATYLTLSPGTTSVLKRSGNHVEGRHPAMIAFVQGILHVVPHGPDHILFVLGIFLLSHRWRPLVSQTLAFTLAHTITLGLAAGGVVRSPAALVEPLIALSIAFLAVENLFVREAGWRRLVLVFGFGLVHGLGFAGVLSAWIHPGEGFIPTLIAANLGVEAGQLAVIAAAWLVTARLHRSEIWPDARRWACLLLAGTGIWWFLERCGLV